MGERIALLLGYTKTLINVDAWGMVGICLIWTLITSAQFIIMGNHIQKVNLASDHQEVRRWHR